VPALAIASVLVHKKEMAKAVEERVQEAVTNHCGFADSCLGNSS
jgi:hypothetical protein